MEPGHYCAWCGIKYGEAKDGEVSHGICRRCNDLYLKPEIQQAKEERANADRQRAGANV
jgi:hypothetical protein